MIPAERPDSLQGYREILDQISTLPMEPGMKLFREACERYFYFFCR